MADKGIKEVIIKDFKGIQDLTIPAEHFTIITGKNGSGKSSVLDAIRFAFTGSCAREDDIRHGAQKASVKVVFEDEQSLERCIAPGTVIVKCNGKKTTAKSLGAFLELRTGVKQNVLQAFCELDYIGALAQKDVSDLFQSILPVRITFDEMAEKFLKSMWNYPGDVKYLEFLRPYFPDGKFGIPEINTAYTKLFAERKEIKQKINLLTGKAQFDIQSLPKESRRELEEAYQGIADAIAAQNNYQKAKQQYDASVKARREAELKLEKLKKEVQTFKTLNKLEDSVLETAKAHITRFESAISKSQEILGTVRNNVAMFQRTLDSLDRPVCPISEKLVCTTDKRPLRQEMESAVEANRKLEKEHVDFITRCRKEIGNRNAIIEKWNADALRYSQKEALERQIREFTLPLVLEKPEERAVVDYVALRTEINAKIGILNNYDAAMKAKAEMEDLCLKLDKLQYGIDVCEPKKGVRLLIMEHAMAPFEALCNQKASLLRPGFQMKFRCENGIEILAEPRKDAGYRDIHRLSTGEFVFAAYLILSVIQAVTSCPILLLDNLDRLDEDSAEAFFKLLAQEQCYQNIFAACVNHEDLLNAAKDVDGCVAMHIDSGKL